MHASISLYLIAGLAQLARADWFKEYNSTDPDCKSPAFLHHWSSALDGYECIVLNEDTVSVVSYINTWTDFGVLYAYSDAGCTSLMGEIDSDGETCWPIDDFNGKGWGQTVQGIMMQSTGM